MTELTVIVQDNEKVRARTQEGAEAFGSVQLDNLQHRLISIFEDWLRQDKISQRREFEGLGTLLYKVLFDSQIGAFFDQKRREAGNAGGRIRLQLSFEQEAGDLASLPWEYLYYPDTEVSPGYFMATDRSLVLSRYMPLAKVRPTLQPDEIPLRILIVVSKPHDLGPVLEAQTVSDIRALSEARSIKIDILDKPTVDSLINVLEYIGPHVVHFIGHGHFSKAEEKGELALLQPNETSAAWIPDREFSDFVTQVGASPRLVVLHLCEGGASAFNANFAGIAPQLIRKGVQAVVAMQFPISNRAAIAFSQAFYQALAKGEPVDSATQMSRLWITTTGDLKAYDSRDFGTPVLYMRSRDGIIQPSVTGGYAKEMSNAGPTH